MNGRLDRILFDYGISHSFIEQDVVVALKLAPEILKRTLEITSPVGKDVVLQ